MSIYLYIFAVLAALFIRSCDGEAVLLTTEDLIRKEGYPVRTHRVFTRDGFILKMHRITGSKKLNATKNKPVVFLQHGLFSTSADWIILGPEKSLGYLLADEGYDVWMGNARGNRYSREHVKYKSEDPRYWDFSWHEMGLLDLPAEIDYILRVTGQRKIDYVGHSMGTTMFFVLTSSKPEYNEKIRHMVALAPIGFMKHTRNALTILGSALHVAQYGVRVLDKLGIGEVNANSPIYRFLMDMGCHDSNPTYMCSNALFSMIGFDNQQMNKTLLPTLLQHTPDTASIKTLLHYAQHIKPLKHSDSSLLQGLLSILNPSYRRYELENSFSTDNQNTTQNLKNSRQSESPQNARSRRNAQNSKNRQKERNPKLALNSQRTLHSENAPNTENAQNSEIVLNLENLENKRNSEHAPNTENPLNSEIVLNLENSLNLENLQNSVKALNSDKEINSENAQNISLPESSHRGISSLNPFNPDSLLNPLNPRNPFNAFSPLNPKSVFSPMNPDNPLHKFIDIWVNDTLVFRQFDYYSENKARYGQLTPPDYDLQAITTPITLFYGDNDLLTDSKDIILFGGRLPNAKVYHVEFDLFNHMDYVWANDVKTLVNDEVILRLK